MSHIPVPLVASREKKYRKRTWPELQPFLFQYGAGISLVSPFVAIRTIADLNVKVIGKVPNSVCAKLAAQVFPLQTLLKVVQMNLASPIKTSLDLGPVIGPLAAFACVGVLQGGVYGQVSVFASKRLGISQEANYSKMFRGTLCAAGRDTISQGVPFLCQKPFREYVVESIFPNTDNTTPFARNVKDWSALFSVSVFSTFASQFLHNWQLTMQSHTQLGYLGAVQKLTAVGPSCFVKGAPGRVGVVLVVNVLNHYIMKPAWTEVEVEE